MRPGQQCRPVERVSRPVQLDRGRVESVLASKYSSNSANGFRRRGGSKTVRADPLSGNVGGLCEIEPGVRSGEGRRAWHRLIIALPATTRSKAAALTPPFSSRITKPHMGDSSRRNRGDQRSCHGRRSCEVDRATARSSAPARVPRRTPRMQLIVETHAGGMPNEDLGLIRARQGLRIRGQWRLEPMLYQSLVASARVEGLAGK